jgi:two-component system, cell cycle sensor histidine kinase and response regulator CckA
MTEKPSYEELEQRITLLENKSAQRKRFEEINRTLFKISNAVNITSNLSELFRKIHLALSPIIDTTNFYIALYDETKDSVTFPYCVDSVDECYPPVIEVSRTASLTAEVIRTGCPIMATKAEILTLRAKSGLKIPACTPSEIWLGVPLKTRDKIIGVMAVQSYHDPRCYDKTDMDVLVSVADQIAIAIERKRTEESLQRTHDKLEQRVKERTEALRESESRLQTLVETIPDLIWLKDPDGVYLDCNTMFERLYGATKKDIIGKTDYDFVDRELADFFIENDRKAMVAGKPRSNEEWLTFASNGYRGLFDTIKTQMYNDDGKLIGVIGIARDITERKQAEEALRESERKYRELFELSPVGIFRTNSKGQALFANPEMARNVGADSPQEAIDKFQDLAKDLYVDPNRRNEFIELLKDKGEVVNFEFEAKGLNGKRLWLSMNARVSEKLSDGTFIIDGFNTDITERKQAEEAMRESREELAEIFSMSLDMICIADINTATFLKVNPAFTRILGYSEQELLSCPFLEFIHPDDVLPTLTTIKERLQKGEAVINFINRYHCKDGTYCWLEWVSHPIPKRGVTFAVAHDITERKRAEEILLKSEKKLQAVFDRSPVGLILLDNHSVVLDCNLHFANTFGVRREEFIGQNLLDGIPEGTVRQIFVDAIFDDGVHHYEGPHASILSGKQLYISISCEKIAPDLLIAIIMDFTERKQTEDALRESEEKFRITYSSSPDAVTISRLDNGLYVDINEGFTRATGYTREEVIGKTSQEINIWHDPADRQKLVQGLQEKGYIENLEAQFGMKDGSMITALMSARVISLKGVPHLISIVRDITERKLIESKLQQAQKFEAIGTLAGGVAHDFNNLLMGIQGRASLISWDLEISHPHREHIHAIEEYIRSAASLTQQMLGFARGGKYEVKPVDMNELVQGSSAMFGRTKKEIRVHAKCQASPLVVDADRGQIEQVLLNMYVNAWQAMPTDGGELYLETKIVTLDEAYCKPHQTASGRYVKVSITDTGAGMDEATRLRIFDPFFTTKEMGRGTGLGLASAFGIIKNHNGMITVYSEIGHGTTFNIYLPVSYKEAHREVSMEGGLIKGSATILLVDDEELIIDVGLAMLERLGYHVMVSRDGQEAVKVISDMGNEIDLVILDMIMPGMDGGTTFDRIREIQPVMPVLLSSGYAINGHADKIIRKGCNGFIQKPYNISELSQIIRKVLDETKGASHA